ncbi:hypothetical protein KU306_00795 [Haloferax larsenii]|uniref:Transposase n=1 Tax=Haloferax larsenii TaxID=302484 RepID=A0ABY5RDS6_HALLR|nr:hypothetical protein [Haloferax larsenii]UVE50481.1 hypothetical protein KU306_00795 [Haloferax larsenii]
MTSYLGVDWAGGCWVVVEAGDKPNVTTEPSIYNVWHEHGKRDDILDAAILAVTAEKIDLQPRSHDAEYPALPKTHEKTPVLGVPMEVVYPGDSAL